MKRITILAAAGALVATPALGVWAANAATSGDDPAAHHHAGHHQRHTGADDKIVVKGLNKVHARHGADDAAGHQRHSSHAEPGDDNGGQGEVEPGDDNGNHAEPGDDNGGNHGGGDDNGGHGHGGHDG